MLQDLSMEEKINLFEYIKQDYGKIYEYALLSKEERRMWGNHYQGITNHISTEE